MVNVIILGSGEYTYRILKKLSGSKFIDIQAIVVPKDSKDKKLLDRLGTHIMYSENINTEAKRFLPRYKPDIIIVCNFGQFLGDYILNFPEYKCLNVHFSLLPKLRGACPIEMAILKAYKRTGVTIQVMEEEMDKGDIIFQKSLKVKKRDTAKSLGTRIISLVEKEIVDVVLKWTKGKITPELQEDKEATYCYRVDISKEKAKIDFTKGAEHIDRQIRAFYPRVIAWCFISTKKRKKRIKIYEAEYSKENTKLKPGDYELIGKERLHIQTADGVIIPLKLQVEGRRIMSVEEFIPGLKEKIIFE